MRNAIAAAAIEYLDVDLSVIPVNDTKKATIEWKQFQHRPLPSGEADRVFKDAWGLALIGGAVSGGVEVIDFDAHGRDITAVYNTFASDEKVALIFSRYKICVERTMRGGYHVAYRYEAKKHDGNQKLASWDDGETMIETRGEGGYTVIAPSPGYTVLSGTFEDLPTLMEQERDYLIDLCRSLTKVVSVDLNNQIQPNTTSANTDPLSFFNWNKSAYAKNLLEDAGWNLQRTDEKTKIEYWQRPGKGAGEAHSATWGWKENALYVFSSSAAPFVQESYYTPFQILVLLRFGGNFRDAFNWVSDKYFNESPPQIVPTIAPVPDPAPTGPITFPIEVFPPKIQDFINELNTSLNYSKDFLATAIMFTVATINGNLYKLDVNGEWLAPTIFWFAVVGEPGTKKSHPISSITSPIRAIDKQARIIGEADYQHWEQEMGKKKGKPTGGAPKYKQILVNDITIESLHDVHSFNRRGLGFYKDELMGLFNAMNQYHKGSDEQFWLESFNNGDYTVNRVTKRPTTIENTMINIIGTIQPSVLSKMTRDYAGNGLTDRFLYTNAEHNIFSFKPKKINPGVLDWWKRQILAFNDHCKYIDKADTIIIEAEQDALEKMAEIDEAVCAMQRANTTSANMKSYLSKRKTYLPRFALVIALIDCMCDGLAMQSVTVDHMERADKVMKYFIDSASEIFDEAAMANEMGEVISVKKGNTTQEKILYLHQKGFKGVIIAKQIGKTPAYVSQVINGKIN